MNVDLSGSCLKQALRERFGACCGRDEAGLPPPADPVGLIQAAVLIPLLLHEETPTILLTRRSEHLMDHPGQICFPGGRVEAGDGSFFQTALREAREEVGIAPSQVEILGVLPDIQTLTGFQVRPVVGVLTPPVWLAVDHTEVAEAFEVPLGVLMDEANHRPHRRLEAGVMSESTAIVFEHRYIWGATARMLLSLVRMLNG